MSVENYSEDRIRNAYRNPSQLTDADCVEIRKRMAADNKSWRVRKKREENAGGFDPKEANRQRNFAASKKRRNSNWLKRELTEDEKRRLSATWVAE